MTSKAAEMCKKTKEVLSAYTKHTISQIEKDIEIAVSKGKWSITTDADIAIIKPHFEGEGYILTRGPDYGTSTKISWDLNDEDKVTQIIESHKHPKQTRHIPSGYR
jgi:hypothetical protein